MKAIFTTLILFLIVSYSVAQNGMGPFKHITTNEGLSQSNVTCILQDDDGFMWFGTQDGLNKYDGKTIKVYKNDPANPKSLSHNYILTLFKDHNGNFWIGSHGGGLNFFERETEIFTQFSHFFNDTTDLSKIRVEAIEEDRDGNLWVGTYGQGLRFIDFKNKKIVHFKADGLPGSISSDFIRDIHVDQQGTVWIANFYDGLNHFDKASGRFTKHKHDPKDPSSLSKNDVCGSEQMGVG